ncbi:hypothetical protein GSI_04699 [Ganoderma sinense ZZ0214-1]|uniref:Uncharacterized protein n=1 Tax=Ganoderma sinense ZZ0214-1 TaxID=1077348 RepID=A0A2G8SHK6_9APHY|nr:hypothetical protein GSI_04699 [Ganoderma sinense ZZ0214-1]
MVTTPIVADRPSTSRFSTPLSATDHASRHLIVATRPAGSACKGHSTHNEPGIISCHHRPLIPLLRDRSDHVHFPRSYSSPYLGGQRMRRELERSWCSWWSKEHA